MPNGAMYYRIYIYMYIHVTYTSHPHLSVAYEDRIELLSRCQEGSPELRHDVELWFGSLGRTLYTLLLSILGGLSWHLVCAGLALGL